jgi:hypothetical protein
LIICLDVDDEIIIGKKLINTVFNDLKTQLHVEDGMPECLGSESKLDGEKSWIQQKRIKEK